MEYSLFFLLDQYPDPHYSVHQIYQQVLDQSLLAEKLNYRGIYVAEHHIKNYGVLPNPAVLLAWIAQATTTLKLGSGITILPFHSPLRVAEEFLMLDLLSDGRAELGIGSGFLPYEFSGFGLDSENKRELFDESLKVIKSLLNKETINIEGKLPHRGKDVQLNIGTYNDRELPIYLAAISPESAYYVGKQGHYLMAVPYNHFGAEKDFPQKFLENYQRGWKDSTRAKEKNHCVMNFFCHVAETDKKARDNIADAFGRYVASRGFRTHTVTDFKKVYDEWNEKGFLLSGSVETVADKINFYRELGLDHMMTFQNFGGADPEIIQSSMELFSQQVMPKTQASVAA